MSNKDWLGRTAQNAAAKARSALNRGAEGAADAASPGFPDPIAAIDSPPVPLTAAWCVGVGQILNSHPKMPERLRGLVRHMDRLGSVMISPDAIGFDGVTVPWEAVQSITFSSPLEVLTSAALHREVRRVTALVPPVPGRGWLVRQIVDVLAGLCLAAAGRGRDASAATDELGSVPLAVAYREHLRNKELTCGVFAALMATSDPAIAAAIMAIARERGISVTAGPQARSGNYAHAFRELAGSLTAGLSHDDEGPDSVSGPMPAPRAAVVDREAQVSDRPKDGISRIFAQLPEPDLGRLTQVRARLERLEQEIDEEILTIVRALPHAHGWSALVVTDRRIIEVTDAGSVSVLKFGDIERIRGVPGRKKPFGGYDTTYLIIDVASGTHAFPMYDDHDWAVRAAEQTRSAYEARRLHTS